MKEKSFKFRESYSNAVRAMNDKQAGRLLKGLCDYAFDGQILESNDATLKSCFTLIKTSLDQEKIDRENGCKGGKLSQELRRKQQEKILFTAGLNDNACSLDGLIKTVLSMSEDELKSEVKKSGDE